MLDLSKLPAGFISFEEALNEMYPIWMGDGDAESENIILNSLTIYHNGKLVAIQREALDAVVKDVLDTYNNMYNLNEKSVAELCEKLDAIYEEEAKAEKIRFNEAERKAVQSGVIPVRVLLAENPFWSDISDILDDDIVKEEGAVFDGSRLMGIRGETYDRVKEHVLSGYNKEYNLNTTSLKELYEALGIIWEKEELECNLKEVTKLYNDLYKK